MVNMQKSLMLSANALFNDEAAEIPLRVRQPGRDDQQPGAGQLPPGMENNPAMQQLM